jgi:hypothetical protein
MPVGYVRWLKRNWNWIITFLFLFLPFVCGLVKGETSGSNSTVIDVTDSYSATTYQCSNHDYVLVTEPTGVMSCVYSRKEKLEADEACYLQMKRRTVLEIYLEPELSQQLAEIDRKIIELNKTCGE